MQSSRRKEFKKVEIDKFLMTAPIKDRLKLAAVFKTTYPSVKMKGCTEQKKTKNIGTTI